MANRTEAMMRVLEFAQINDECLDNDLIDLLLDYIVWVEERIEELEAVE